MNYRSSEIRGIKTFRVKREQGQVQTAWIVENHKENSGCHSKGQSFPTPKIKVFKKTLYHLYTTITIIYHNDLH